MGPDVVNGNPGQRGVSRDAEVDAEWRASGMKRWIVVVRVFIVIFEIGFRGLVVPTRMNEYSLYIDEKVCIHECVYACLLFFPSERTLPILR